PQKDGRGDPIELPEQEAPGVSRDGRRRESRQALERELVLDADVPGDGVAQPRAEHQSDRRLDPRTFAHERSRLVDEDVSGPGLALAVRGGLLAHGSSRPSNPVKIGTGVGSMPRRRAAYTLVKSPIMISEKSRS